MRSYSTEGIVIKRSNVGETDRIITLFTPHKGKISLIAKGVRKLSSKRSGSIELFNIVKISAIPGKTGLDILAEVQLIDSFPKWKKHLGRITLAYQLAETVDKLIPDHEPHDEIYAILMQSLSQIGTLGKEWEANMKSWLVQIVREAGYWPKDKLFTGNIHEFLEETTSRAFHSQKLLKRLT